MKRSFLYLLLFSGLVAIAGLYIYKQFQYKKFEEFFMGARLYGSSKMVLDTTFAKTNKQNNVKDYRYSFVLKNKKSDLLTRDFHITTSFNQKFEDIGGGIANDFFNVPIFNINNRIYLENIPEKEINLKKSAYYLVVEYEKNRKIRYYFEITENINNKKYTIYFKSYAPQKVLNAENKYIKD